ncbi:SET domain-containing protein [Siminovitchia acidinfaciens]|uniref:SET domain-containing protein n=1 Tax=Siminovitchia acidinfaciens TaxID=2321395 RepID=UPI002E25B8EE
MSLQKVSVQDTGKYGRGVFALCDFKKGDLIESAPVIVLSKSERKYIKKTKLNEYFFNWGKKYRNPAIALGYGSLYNHSYTPNSKFVNNLDQYTIDFYALKDIKKGEEITVNYNGDPDSESNVWFEVIK